MLTQLSAVRFLNLDEIAELRFYEDSLSHHPGHGPTAATISLLAHRALNTDGAIGEDAVALEAAIQRHAQFIEVESGHYINIDAIRSLELDANAKLTGRWRLDAGAFALTEDAAALLGAVMIAACQESRQSLAVA
jgi:hypothetical protein